MKKLATILLLSSLTLGLVACGSNDEETKDPTTQEETVTANFEPSEVLADFEASMNPDELVAQQELDAAMLKELYKLDDTLVESFTAKIPMISAQYEEYLVIKAKEGKAEEVKDLFMQRIDFLKDPSNMTYPEHLDLIDDYKLSVKGDYVLFAIGHHSQKVLDAFEAKFE